MKKVPLYTKVGQLRSRRAYYYAAGGHWAVEHDYTYLVEPTTEERTEIYGIFPRAEPEEI